MRNQPPMVSLAMVFILDRCAGTLKTSTRTGVWPSAARVVPVLARLLAEPQAGA